MIGLLPLLVVYLPLTTAQAAVSPAVNLISLMGLIIPTMFSLTAIDFIADLLLLMKSGFFAK